MGELHTSISSLCPAPADAASSSSSGSESSSEEESSSEYETDNTEAAGDAIMGEAEGDAQQALAVRVNNLQRQTLTCCLLLTVLSLPLHIQALRDSHE
jgi:hypothetical protein